MEPAQETVTTALNTNKPNKLEEYDVTKNQSMETKEIKEELKAKRGLYPFMAFMLIGTVQLIGWNTLLNSQNSVFAIVFNKNDPPPTITVTYSTVSFISTCFSIYYTEYLVRPVVTYIGLVLTGVSALIYAIVSHLSYSAALGLFYVIAVLMGVSSSLIGCSAFGYANYFPQNYGGALSAGLGFAGVINFVLWILARFAIFSDNAAGMRGAMWFLNGYVMIMTAVSLVLIYKFLNEPWVKEVLNTHERQKQQRLAQAKYENTQCLPEEETVLETMKKTLLLTFLFFFTMFVTLFGFPTIGPYRWPDTKKEQDLLIGVFQAGDLIGRYMPNYLQFTLIKKRALVIFGLLRAIFMVSFYLSYLLKENVFFSNTVFHFIQMAVFSISNGWLITCLFVRIPDFVQSAIAKARCGSIALLAIVFGIFVGQWAAYFSVL